MNNVSIDKIKENLQAVLNYFDPTKSTYSIINSCITNDMTAEEMQTELTKIGSTNDYPKEFQNFFYQRFEELKLLAEKDREISNLKEEIEKKHQELENEFIKRNVSYNTSFIKNDNYKKMTYNEKKEYISKCKEEIKRLDNQLQALTIEKSSGEKFDEKLNTNIQNKDIFIENNSEETKKIQEKSETNVISYSNPTSKDVLNYINDYQNNSSENSRLNIKVEYQNDSSVKLNIGYNGTEVNEKYPRIECYFSDINTFNNDIYPVLLEEHVIDGGIKGYNTENGQLKSENLDEETLEVSGNDNIVNNTKNYLDNQIAMEKTEVNSLNNKSVRVRKLENPHNQAKANVIIVTISLILMIAILILLVTFIF